MRPGTLKGDALRSGSSKAEFKLSETTIRVGVIGCGFFGGLHAQKYAEAPGVELVGVFDVDAEAAGKVAAKTSTQPVETPDELIGRVDAVSITAPAAFHYDLAHLFLSNNIHVLVEKPIALRLDHADTLIALAESQSLVLQVGHQERYVFEDFGVIGRSVAPKEIRARRAGPFSGRAMDVSAVFDLMIHDLDLIHQVSSAEIVDVEATGKTVHGDHADEVDVKLMFADGCEAHVLASRIADERQRDMKIIYPDGVVEIDFVNRTIFNSTPEDLRTDFDGNEQSKKIMGDPLGYGIGAFIDAVRNGTPPRVTGAQARRALATAIRISEDLAA